MEPGRHLCIDESMCQWLGKDMPSLKKVPRKPHPIGQEYKTLADCDTYCILRLDFVSDKFPKKFDDTDRNLIATVKRLTEPWFYSGRTVIADSWFGSPEMANELYLNGVFSIMQVCKRRYWPRGMPSDLDMIQDLGTAYGDTLTMVSIRSNGCLLLASSYQDKKPKAIVATCGTTKMVAKRTFRDSSGQKVVIDRSQVFEEYETKKSAVDIANNRRDNLDNFHDVMKSYRWEVRTLAFFLGIAEANAFSAFKRFHHRGHSMTHGVFKDRLAQEILEEVHGSKDNYEQTAGSQPRTRASQYHMSVSLGNLDSGKPRRVVCTFCRKRTMHRCSCDRHTPLCQTCQKIHSQEAIVEQMKQY
ncbi:unnamed protein product [Absidia cylindrospora]